MVRCIDWHEDDMGFTSCGTTDGNVFYYDLALHKETGNRNNEKDLTLKGVQFTGLCNVPGQLYTSIVAGKDRHIYKTNDPDNKNAQIELPYTVS